MKIIYQSEVISKTLDSYQKHCFCNDGLSPEDFDFKISVIQMNPCIRTMKIGHRHVQMRLPYQIFIFRYILHKGFYYILGSDAEGITFNPLNILLSKNPNPKLNDILFCSPFDIRGIVCLPHSMDGNKYSSEIDLFKDLISAYYGLEHGTNNPFPTSENWAKILLEKSPKDLIENRKMLLWCCRYEVLDGPIEFSLLHRKVEFVKDLYFVTRSIFDYELYGCSINNLKQLTRRFYHYPEFNLKSHENNL